MSRRRPHHPSGASPGRSLRRRFQEVWATSAANLGLDADRWADWLTSTRVLEDGINPSAGHPPRTARDPHTSTHDAPGVIA
ncbi:hypothetical protein GCM10009696_18500 [Kocuria himachalensis]